jgi:hypothetical protein
MLLGAPSGGFQLGQPVAGLGMARVASHASLAALASPDHTAQQGFVAPATGWRWGAPGPGLHPGAAGAPQQ